MAASPQIIKTMPRTSVISTAAERSGEISRLYGTRPLVAGDLSFLRFIRAQSLCHSYRRVPPLEMTQGLEAYHQNKS